MRKNQIIAGIMIASMTFGIVGGNLAPVTVAANDAKNVISDDYTFNQEGLWLTEIYSNDINRGSISDSYVPIKTFDTTNDVMEFIEIASTYKTQVKLNDLYDVYYGNTKLTITDIDGNSDITVSPDQNIVLWNYTKDASENNITEADFRNEMHVAEDAKVLKVTNGTGWGVTATFSIKTKADNNVVSTYKAVDKVDTADGFSVELKVPNIGSDMEVYQLMDEPTPGTVYSGQLNGLKQTAVPDAQKADGVYITEIRPNDVNRITTYGIGDDLMECVEVVNTTDHAVDMNKDYQMMYMVKEGNRKLLPLYKYDESSDTHIGSSEDCVIPAGKSAVLWCYRQSYLTGYTSFPTEAEFRDANSIPDDVPVYLFTAQNGLNNTNRAFDLYKINEDGSRKLVSNYAYNGSTDLKDNKSVDLMVNPEGPEMLIATKNAGSSMGKVTESQYSYLKDDGSRMSIAPREDIPASIMQGKELRVQFDYAVSENLPRTGITTYYRFDGEGSWYSSTEANRRVPGLYEMNISADELFSHDYVEFYVSADNRYRSTLSSIYKVNVDKLNNVDGIRTNIEEGQVVNKTVTVTANDGKNNASSTVAIDGSEYETEPVMENGAFFTFHADGRDSYFHNMITTTDNKFIASILKWQYRILDGQAVHIDNSYFTYNKDTNSYDITLRLWAGTYGATVEDYLMPTANREDFTVKQLAMRLINGKVYYPTAIAPTDSATSAKTNMSKDFSAVHSIGDSAGMCPYMDVSYSIPATEVTAVGAQIDTTKMAEGKHTIHVSDGADHTQNVNFVVDNTAPVIETGIEEGSELSGNITINPQVTDANADDLVASLDGESITLPYNTTAYKLGKGEHTLVVYAKDAAGNETEKTTKFVVKNVDIALTDVGTTDITDTSASAYLTLSNGGTDTNATFYKAEKVKTSSVATDTSSDILPYVSYTIDVGETKGTDSIVANWDGTASNTDNTHASTMYVLNTVNGNWDVVAKADSTGSIKEGTFAAAEHVKDGKATVIVQCTADSTIPDTDTATNDKKDTNKDWDGTTVPEDYDFCFAWETDTQYYAEEWQHHYLNINNWIVNNADKLGIKYVIHTGDIVDDYDMKYEWDNADQAMSILDKAGMPYGVLAGNHDVAAGSNDYENYYKYFGQNRFATQPTYGGTYENNKGHYDLISQNGQDMIVLYMSWDIYQNEIDWMNQVLKQYSDRKAILCFHTYTNVKTSTDTYLDYFGQMVQENVVAKNPNVMAVLNGHYHGSSYETAMFDDDKDGKNDRTVYQICTDYQSGFEGGNEYIKFLYFDLDNDKIYMNSYSPCMNDFNYYDNAGVKLNQEGAKGQDVDIMTLDVNFDTKKQTILPNSFSAYVCRNEQLGTAAMDQKTNKVTLDMSGLKNNTEYTWYATVSNDETGYLKTGLNTFTTKVTQSSPDTKPDTNPDKKPDTNTGSNTNSDAATDNSGKNDAQSAADAKDQQSGQQSGALATDQGILITDGTDDAKDDTDKAIVSISVGDNDSAVGALTMDTGAVVKNAAGEVISLDQVQIKAKKSTEAATKLNQAFETNGVTIGSNTNTLFYELELVDADGNPLTLEEGKATVYFSLPEGIDYDKYNFIIYHLAEDGVLETLEPSVSQDGLAVEVNGFSPFAVTYSLKDQSSASSVTNVKTGDHSNMVIYIVIAVGALGIIALAGYEVIHKKNKIK